MKIRELVVTLIGILLFATCCVYAEDGYSNNPNENQEMQENVDIPATADTPIIDNKDGKDLDRSGGNTFKPELNTEPVGKHLETDPEKSVNDPNGPGGGSECTESVNNPKY